jgi:hypothetical protein
MKITRIALIFWLTFYMGCGTWIGNPENPEDDTDDSSKATVDLEIVGDDTAALASSNIDVIGASGSSIGTITISKAIIALKEVKFELTSGSSNSKVEFEGPYIVDLLNNVTYPDPGSVQVDEGLYTKIKLKLAKVSDDDAEDAGITDTDIHDRSIYIAGTFFSTSGESKSLEMSFDFGESFEIESEDGITLESGTSQAVQLAFKLQEWFDFSNEETNSDGYDFEDITASSIILTDDGEDVEDELQDVIKENIKESADMLKGD